MSVNLGQVAAILYGTTAPGNTNVLWGVTTTNDPNTWTLTDIRQYKSGAWTSLSGAGSPEARTGTTVKFDIPMRGAAYNTTSPNGSATLTIDMTGAVAGGCVQFKNDGTEITSFVNGSGIIWGNNQQVGTPASLFLYYDGTDIYGNWLPGEGASATPQLSAPSFALTSGASALELDYSALSLDANSTGSTMEISADQVNWYAVTGAEYTHGDTSGSIAAINGSALTGGTTYYVRVRSSATGYTSSAYATQSAAASSTPSLSTPTIALVAGNAQLAYTISGQDANATAGVMEISDDNVNWVAVQVGEYDGDPATTSGTLLKIGAANLTNGTLYYVRFKNTASGYTDSAYASDSETPAVVYSPLDLANLISWHDASDTSSITATGTNAEIINDKSGNGWHLTTVGTDYPQTGVNSINGLNVLTANDIEYMSKDSVDIGTTGNLMVAVVLKPAGSGGSGSSIMSMDATSNDFQIQTAGASTWDPQLIPLSGGTIGFTSTWRTITHLFVAIFDFANNTHKVYINGVLETAVVGTNPTVGGYTTKLDQLQLLRIFANRAANASRFIGDFAEMVIANEIDDTSRQELEAYLLNKWGII